MGNVKIPRRAVNNGIKALIAACILGYLLFVLDPAEIWATIKNARPLLAFLALILLPVNLLLEYLVWKPFAILVVDRLPIRKGFFAVLSGYAIGLFTPGRIGEFAGRALSLTGDRVRIATSLAAVRIVELLIVCSIGIVALLAFLNSNYVGTQHQNILLLAIAYGAFIITLVASTLAFPSWAEKTWGRLVFSKWRSKLNVLDFFSDRSRVLRVLALGTLRYAVFNTQLVLCLMAFQHDLVPRLAYLAAMLVFYTKVVIPPVTFMDLGIREGASTFFLSQMGYSGAAAFSGALLLFAINILLPALLGLPFVSRIRFAD